MEALPVVDDDDSDDDKKKDKKLVFLSRSVLQKVRERPMVTGTQIANEILEMYKKFCDVSFSLSPLIRSHSPLYVMSIDQ